MCADTGAAAVVEEIDIVAAGHAGEAGAVRIAREKFSDMLRRFRKDYAEHLCEETKAAERLAELISAGGAAASLGETGSCICIPAGEGGILAALYRAAKERKCGLRIALKSIPVRQDTIELCELYGLNPYRLYSRCVIFLCGNGGRLAERLRERGIPAEHIGRMTRGLDKIITDKTETEYLNRPEPDELLKVLPEMKIRQITEEDRNA